MGAAVFSAGGATAVWFYQHLGCGGMLGPGPQGLPCQEQGGEESLVEELPGHHQEDEKGDGSWQKKGARKVRGNSHLSGFLLKSCLAGWQIWSGEQDSQEWSQNMCGMGWG